MIPSGGGNNPAGVPPAPRPGHIPCVVCRHTIGLDQYRQARCWTDPHGITCAAHAACLQALGETDLGLTGDAA
jgi:hypothetical protein